MNDIILRDCGSVGWLGLVEQKGVELYRTGKHYASVFDCLNRVQEWIEENQK